MKKSMLVVFGAIFLFCGCGAVTETSVKRAVPSSSERIEANKALARVWFDEVINRRNPEAIADTYAIDYVHHGPDGVDMRGSDAARTFADALLAASDDRQAVVEQQVAEGDLVVTRFTSTGHHTGVFLGAEPSGGLWTTTGICISRVKDGKIVEDWELVHQSKM